MMIKKPLPYLLVAPLAIGVLTAPLSATTEHPSTIDDVLVDTTRVELIYPQFAQVGGDEVGGRGGGGPDDDNSNRPRPERGPVVEVSTPQTSAIVQNLERAQRICEFMGDEYRISCFGQTYRQLADEIPANGDYAEAREILLDTARQLDNVVRRNLDRRKPALSAQLSTTGGQTVNTPPIRAIREDRVTQINQQAAAIVEEAETKLLRVANSDAARAVHYQRISAVVGSNKVLLRSS